MNDQPANIYDDPKRAAAYAELEFPGTYHLACRDLPAIIGEHVRGARALDFGCGAGRSTRLLRRLGFEPVIGVDIAAPMLAHARRRDPQGDYRLLEGDELNGLGEGSFDLVLSLFTFDNIPTMERKTALFRSLRRVLNEDGRIVNVVSAPEIYVNEWVSFTTRDFPENRLAQSGDSVRIVMLDGADRRPVEDILCTHASYLDAYRRAGLAPVDARRPLASPEDRGPWISETTIAPWVIYVLRRRS